VKGSDDKAATFEREARQSTGVSQSGDASVSDLALRLAALSSVELGSLSPDELASTKAALTVLQQKLTAAIAASEPRASQSSTAASSVSPSAASSSAASSSARGGKIDALFDAGRFAELVPVLVERAAELGATPLSELGHEALLANMASLHVLQHQLIGTL